MGAAKKWFNGLQNARRIELIMRKFKLAPGTLTPDEKAELVTLQAIAISYLPPRNASTTQRWKILFVAILSCGRIQWGRTQATRIRRASRRVDNDARR